MRGDDRSALPLAATAFVFSAVALPYVYFAVPFCTPMANGLLLGATVAAVSASAALSFAGLLLSLFSLYVTRTARSRYALALSAAALGIATAFIVFGLALRNCPA